MCEEIKTYLFSGQSESEFYQFGNNDEWMTEYLSLYYPPSQLAEEKEDGIEGLFQRVN